MWHKIVGVSFFRFATIHVFDRQTDGQTDRLLAHRNSTATAVRVTNGLALYTVISTSTKKTCSIHEGISLVVECACSCT